MKYSILATALAGFLALTTGCTGDGNALPETEGSSKTRRQAGSNKENTEPTKPETILAFSCKDVPLEQCEDKFFDEQRCERSGQTCVELQQSITFTTKRCDELSSDECGKSTLCLLNGNACKDRQYVFESPCKDKGKDPCLAESICLFDSVIQRCGKNPYGGRCVFDATKCVLNGMGDDCANVHGGACRKVEVAAGAECRLNTNICALLNSGNGAVTGPTNVVLTTSDVNAGGVKAVQANGVISHDAARTSAAICIGDPANPNEDDRAIPNPAAATACQDIFAKELADMLAKNTKDGGTYDTRTQGYPAICTGLEIKGAVVHNNGAVNEIRADGGDNNNFLWWNKNTKAANIGIGSVNATNWCHWVPKKTIQCETDKTQLRNADPCKDHTQEACAKKTECLWEPAP